MESSEFESVPFAYAGESGEAAWEFERRPVPARGRSAPPSRPRPRPTPGRRPTPAGRSLVAPCVCPAHGTEFIRWVQSGLNQVEGSALPIDGVMNAATRAALRRFQSRQGLPVDGIAGPEVEQALREARRGNAAPAPGKAEDPPEASEAMTFETLEFEAPSGMPTLRQGSRGSAVTDLQRRLAGAGFSPGPIDGIFGSQTDAAVRSFQRARGLGVDGIVGPITWGALLNTRPIGPGPAPTPAPAAGVWVMPPEVAAAANAQTVRYDPPPKWIGNPGNCTGTFTDGAATLRTYIQANFSGVSSIGGYSCRPNSATPDETSVHGTGRALDVMIPMVGGRANSAVGDRIANWLVSNASAIGVQYVIWNRVRWSGSRTPRVAPYTGPVPHTDHVHVELNEDGANRRTPWFRGREVAGADEFEFEFESDFESGPGGSAILSCGPAPDIPKPAEGSCVPGIGDASCTQGVWYRPRWGDNLSDVAERTLARSGASGVGLRDYMRQISRHRHNAQYLMKDGYAKRQFYRWWGGPHGRTYVGTGGQYGLMFLPPLGPGLERAACPQP